MLFRRCQRVANANSRDIRIVAAARSHSLTSCPTRSPDCMASTEEGDGPTSVADTGFVPLFVGGAGESPQATDEDSEHDQYTLSTETEFRLMNDLQRQIVATRDQVAQLQGAKDEISKLQQQLEHAQHRVREAEQAVYDAQQQQHASEERLVAATSELEAARAVLVSTRASVSTLEAEVQQLRQELEEQHASAESRLQQAAREHESALREQAELLQQQAEQLQAAHQALLEAQLAQERTVQREHVALVDVSMPPSLETYLRHGATDTNHSHDSSATAAVPTAISSDHAAANSATSAPSHDEHEKDDRISEAERQLEVLLAEKRDLSFNLTHAEAEIAHQRARTYVLA